MKFCLSLVLMICLAFPAAAERALPIPLTENTRGTLLISLAGDCCLASEGRLQERAGQFIQVVGEKGLEHPFSGVRQIFEGDDLTLVNLENTFTGNTSAAQKRYTFRAPADFAQILTLGDVEAVNLANNHTLDYFEEGLTDTRAALDAVGVLYCDVGKPAVYEAKGVRIGLLGATAPRQTDIDTMIAQKQELQAQGVSLFIASMHWGHEYYYNQNREQTDFARQLIDAGFDIVAGSHPHVLQGVEYYNGRPIFYSLGNFSFGGNRDPRDWDTMIAQVRFDLAEGGPELSLVRIIPCRISEVQGAYQDFRPVPVDELETGAILTKVAKYSVGFPETFFLDGYFVPGDETLE